MKHPWFSIKIWILNSQMEMSRSLFQKRTPMRAPSREDSPKGHSSNFEHLLLPASCFLKLPFLLAVQTAGACYSGKLEVACPAELFIHVLLLSIRWGLLTLLIKLVLEDIKWNIVEAVYEQLSSKSLRSWFICAICYKRNQKPPVCLPELCSYQGSCNYLSVKDLNHYSKSLIQHILY